MIYIPAYEKRDKKEYTPDICFFVTKDGYSSRIDRLGFNGKESKEPVTSAFELKTQNIYIFTYH
jgi:hypothetical protein